MCGLGLERRASWTFPGCTALSAQRSTAFGPPSQLLRSTTSCMLDSPPFRLGLLLWLPQSRVSRKRRGAA